MKSVIPNDKNQFELLRNLPEEGGEFWYARALQGVLDYSEWRKFEQVIKKAIISCKTTGYPTEDHFVQVDKMVKIGSGTSRVVRDYQLTRYACYLIVQNGNAIKPVIAHGQTYFAIQTRRQELQESERFRHLSEDDRRIALREELANHNKDLASAAKGAGVESGLDYAIFQNHGYKGLYGGLDNKAIHARKKLKKSHKILDHMGSTELAANLFRATQTEEKLKRDQIASKNQANQTHHNVGVKIRETIQELGGAMPEDLPTPEESVKTLFNKQQKKLDQNK